MNWETTIAIIRKGQSATQKFFTTLSSLDELGPTLVGMANTEGGHIVVGFDAQNYHLHGCELSEDWFQKILSYCKPSIPFTIDFVDKNNKTIVVLTIPKQANKGFSYKNTGYTMDHDTPIVTVFDTSHNQWIEIKEIEEEKVTDSQNETTYEITITENPTIQIEEVDEDENLEDIENEFSTEQSSEYMFETTNLEELPAEFFAETPADNNPFKFMEALSTAVEILDTNRSQENLFQEPLEASPIGLNKRQQGAINYLNDKKSIQNKKYRELFQVSHKTAHLELIALVKEGHIASTGAGRSTCYVLARNEASQSF